MTRYMLDTTALIDFSKGREPASSRILRMIESGDKVGVCAIVVAEFYAGLAPEQRVRWDEFFEALLFWGVTLEAAKQAGVWCYEFARKGAQLSTTDLLVAAVANQREAVLVTNNVKDYPMDEINVLPLKD
ncbi:MAG: PIN domain-containing protein [Dehalococcoidia bacterium]|nr:PIN domain-containing protein [Dehalococcoidia bacterium]